MAFDKWFLLIGEGIERDDVMSGESAELWIYEGVYKMIRR